MIWRAVVWAGTPEDKVGELQEQGFAAKIQWGQAGATVMQGWHWKILDRWCWYEGEDNVRIAKGKVRDWQNRKRRELRNVSGVQVKTFERKVRAGDAFFTVVCGVARVLVPYESPKPKTFTVRRDS